jgi:hypothetical protein
MIRRNALILFQAPLQYSYSLAIPPASRVGMEREKFTSACNS